MPGEQQFAAVRAEFEEPREARGRDTLDRVNQGVARRVGEQDGQAPVRVENRALGLSHQLSAWSLPVRAREPFPIPFVVEHHSVDGSLGSPVAGETVRELTWSAEASVLLVHGQQATYALE